ncbi:MAG: mechanosensitive ion channel family protein [Solirubrobacterales bacterium]|nr:mechanosensitive ion channel family protein [Solirubrobacterales bacterium]HMT05503.1 mechanosensitive ion channel family protein [Solirubrobacterales bacterium]
MAFRRNRHRGEKTRSQMPRWMFETRTDQWHEAGLGHEISSTEQGRTWPRLLLFALLIAGVLIAFNHRQDIAAGYDTEARILTAILLFGLGWGFTSALGRTLTPFIMRRLDPGTAGTVGFAIRLVTIVLIGVVALRIAGVQAGTLAVGGAFTAVVLGLAAQQTLGNVFAGVVLQSTRPFRVGERVRLTGGPMAGSVEGTVSSLGLFYISILKGQDRMMIPNSLLLNLAVEPLREPDSIDLRARFDSHLSPALVQDMLQQAIDVPTLRPPRIELEEVDRDEVVLRISATPVNPSDGSKLAEQIISVTRGTFEYEKPDLGSSEGSGSGPDNKPDPDVPLGHS